LYLRYMLDDGSMTATEFERVGIVSHFAYDSVYFGGDNKALNPLISLINTQNKGLIKGIENGAVVRFMGKIDQSLKEKDIDKMRERFNKNLDMKNNKGIAVYDNAFEEVIQLKPENGTLNASQSKLIEESVSKYFGIPESIMKNDYNYTQLEAFINGKIQPFARQLSEAVTNMTFSERERAFDNKIEFYSQITDYISFEQKIELANKGVDRRILKINEARELYGYAPVPEGDIFIQRLDYGISIENNNADEGESNGDQK